MAVSSWFLNKTYQIEIVEKFTGIKIIRFAVTKSQKGSCCRWTIDTDLVHWCKNIWSVVLWTCSSRKWNFEFCCRDWKLICLYAGLIKLHNLEITIGKTFCLKKFCKWNFFQEWDHSVLHNSGKFLRKLKMPQWSEAPWWWWIPCHGFAMMIKINNKIILLNNDDDDQLVSGWWFGESCACKGGAVVESGLTTTWWWGWGWGAGWSWGWWWSW